MRRKEVNFGDSAERRNSGDDQAQQTAMNNRENYSRNAIQRNYTPKQSWTDGAPSNESQPPIKMAQQQSNSLAHSKSILSKTLYQPAKAASPDKALANDAV